MCFDKLSRAVRLQLHAKVKRKPAAEKYSEESNGPSSVWPPYSGAQGPASQTSQGIGNTWASVKHILIQRGCGRPSNLNF